jgi:hypothetical protein
MQISPLNEAGSTFGNSFGIQEHNKWTQNLEN